MQKPDLCALTRVIDSSDPCWDVSTTIVDTLEGLRAKFDLSNGVPYGWRLLKGKAARKHIQRAIREERRYRQQMAGIGRN
jgi:hypothetical protein